MLFRSKRRVGFILFTAVVMSVVVLTVLIAGDKLVAFVAYGPGVWHEKTDLQSDLLDAEARWETHAPSHYSLSVTITNEPAVVSIVGWRSCQVDVDVQNGHAVISSPSSCLVGYAFPPPTTVPGFFKLLEQDTTEVRWGHDADCGDLSVVHATYDPQFGYPTHILYTWENATPGNMGWNTYRQFRGSSTGYKCLANYGPNKPDL